MFPEDPTAQGQNVNPQQPQEDQQSAVNPGIQARIDQLTARYHEADRRAAELQQQFVENVGIGSAGLNVLDVGEQAAFEVVAVGIPRTDVGGVELENSKTCVACNKRGVTLDLGGGATQAFFGNV